jgi:hypothetical protein
MGIAELRFRNIAVHHQHFCQIFIFRSPAYRASVVEISILDSLQRKIPRLGRRVDVLGRDIPVADKMSPKDAIVAYLQTRRTATAKFWSLRPVVALTPAKMLGQVIWKGSPR